MCLVCDPQRVDMPPFMTCPSSKLRVLKQQVSKSKKEGRREGREVGRGRGGVRETGRKEGKKGNKERKV